MAGRTFQYFLKENLYFLCSLEVPSITPWPREVSAFRQVANFTGRSTLHNLCRIFHIEFDCGFIAAPFVP